MKKGKILLVEDDESLGFIITDNLILEGYTVTWKKNGKEGAEAALSNDFDICLLDVMLPQQDGFHIARAIRKQNEFVPIIFLTARSNEEDRLKGFEIGGDDYLTKPFSIQELIYRIRVFIRRSQDSLPQIGAQPENVGLFRFSHDLLELSSQEATFSLTQREADLLLLLAAKKNAIVKRSYILEKLWGEDDYFKGRSLDVFISRLRKYLKLDPSLEIRNHHGVGFCLRDRSS